MPSWSDVQLLVGEVGITRAAFLVFFVLSHCWIFRLYMARLTDRQLEMNRLVADNLEYGERFVRMLDQQTDYRPPPARQPSDKPKKGDR
jgi:hypothetical protein